jgi:hypothetical protein
MRNILILTMFAASFVHAAWTDYEEARDLALDAEGIGVLKIEAGAGSLEISGVPGGNRIVVSAIVQVPDADADEAKELMDDHMVLSLVRKGDEAELKSYFESRGSLFGDSPGIRLAVQLPEGMSLDIEDSSGSIQIGNVAGDIRLDDGSGSIKMTNVGGNLTIEDGSGSLSISDAGGDVSIVDGSGSISLRGIAGSVSIDDGSGSIDVIGVAGDVTIPEAGSGSVNVREVEGQVEQGS